MSETAGMKFFLLPGKNPTANLSENHEIAFNFWYDNWSAFFKKNDFEYKLNPDDFFRQDYVGLLIDGKTPLAIHLYSIFNISLSYQLQQSYCFSNFTKSYFEKINQLKIVNCISFESMMVNPVFRKIENGKSIAPMLYAQGIQLVKALDSINAMIAPARNDIGVTRLAISGGAESIEEHSLHGFPVSLIIGRKERLHLGFLSELEQKNAVNIFTTESNLELISQKQNQQAQFKKVS